VGGIKEFGKGLFSAHHVWNSTDACPFFIDAYHGESPDDSSHCQNSVCCDSEFAELYHLSHTSTL
jgi:hypothetical protein